MKSHMKTHTRSLQCDLCPTSNEKSIITVNNHCPNTKGDNMDLVGPHTVALTLSGNTNISRHIKKCTACGKSLTEKKKKDTFSYNFVLNVL